MPLAIEQSAASAPPSIVQARPGVDGSVSVNTTCSAEPSPLFVTVRVKPMLVPALTTSASAVLVGTRSEQLTEIVAVEEFESTASPSATAGFPPSLVAGSLVAAALAVLVSTPQSSKVVGAV